MSGPARQPPHATPPTPQPPPRPRCLWPGCPSACRCLVPPGVSLAMGAGRRAESRPLRSPPFSSDNCCPAGHPWMEPLGLINPFWVVQREGWGGVHGGSQCPGVRALTASVPCSPRTLASPRCFSTSSQRLAPCPHAARRASADVTSVPPTCTSSPGRPCGCCRRPPAGRTPMPTLEAPAPRTVCGMCRWCWARLVGSRAEQPQTGGRCWPGRLGPVSRCRWHLPAWVGH